MSPELPAPLGRRSDRIDDPDRLSDAELLRRVAAGSEAAFCALWERYGPGVHRVCRRILRDPAAAEDATQEAFLRIWRGAERVDERRGDPTAWLFVVARNAALNVARVRLPTPTEDVEIDGSEDIERELIDRLWVDGALECLPHAEREVIELAYFADLSHRQIAIRQGEPLGTVKSRIRRALGRMADSWERR